MCQYEGDNLGVLMVLILILRNIHCNIEHSVFCFFANVTVICL